MIKTSDQAILESLYEGIVSNRETSLKITTTNEDFKNIIRKGLKKAAPYFAATGLAYGANDPSDMKDQEMYKVNKTQQFSTSPSNDFYKKARERENGSKYSSEPSAESFAKSIKTYLIKKINNTEELKESTDVYVDILKIVNKEDNNTLISVEVSGRILASSQEEANKKAKTLIKSALEESNVSIEGMEQIYSESVNKLYNFKIRADLLVPQ